jgi:type IV pilus assembly protein PilE
MERVARRALPSTSLSRGLVARLSMWMQPIRRFNPRRGDGARQSGFTLLELVIVVAIVAILASVALTSYAAQMRKSARAEAQSALTDAASRQQQFLVDRRRYAGSMTVLGVATPPDLASKYTFTVVAVDGPPPTFTLTAQAIGNQAKDTCPTLILDSAGNRAPTSCW